MTKTRGRAKARTRASSTRNRVGSPASAPPRPNEFEGAINQLLTFEAVLTSLLRTCDDAIWGRMSDGSRDALMAACDDVRAALGYSHRYLTPRERRRRLRQYTRVASSQRATTGTKGA